MWGIEGADVSIAILLVVGREPEPTAMNVLAEVPLSGAFTPPLFILNMVKSFAIADPEYPSSGPDGSPKYCDCLSAGRNDDL